VTSSSDELAERGEDEGEAGTAVWRACAHTKFEYFVRGERIWRRRWSFEVSDHRVDAGNDAPQRAFGERNGNPRIIVLDGFQAGRVSRTCCRV